jgi:hypothetical protein
MITFLELGRHGNIGNSMFQLAATIGAARKKGFEIKIPEQQLNHIKEKTNYISLLKGFNISLPFITEVEIRSLKHFYKETYFHYDDRINEIEDYTNLYGYFQSEKYFLHVKEEIKSIFNFKSQHIFESTELFKRYNIHPEETVSLHVRRGDYIEKQYFHPLQDNNYFVGAYKIAKLKNILVFSDDIQWCRKNITGKNIYYSDLSCPFSDLKAMSLCKNNIIVNSTFSWWAAWLNLNLDKIVVAPKIWFGPGYDQHDTKDILPLDWKKI